MLTQRQAELLSFIESYQATHGFSPSFDEMRIALQVASKGTIHRFLMELERRGFITHTRARARSIELLRQPRQTEREAQLVRALRLIAGMTILSITEQPDRPRAAARRALDVVLQTRA